MPVNWIHNLQPAAHSPLAAAFISPWFFAAGAVLMAVPIIIHLLNRRRFKVVQWAAMEYLLAAMRKNRRRLKFEQWLLLAVRCLLLFLLGVALARPLGCDNSSLAALAGQRNGLHVFVIDNSYSMAYEAERGGASKTHLDQAKIIAKAMVDKILRGGESVAIVTAAHPATAVIAKPTYSLDATHAAIDGIEQSYAGTDLAAAVDKATAIARDESRQPTKNLYLITDGTRSSMEGAQADALKNAARDAAAVFGSDAAHFHVFDLGRPDQWNQAILDLKPVGNLITTKFSADFTALARGYGTGPEPGVQWFIDDKPVGGGTVKLSEATPPVTLANQAIRNGGPHVVMASIIGDDRLKLDNSRTRVVNVASEVPILVVDGERSSAGLSGASAFVETAISPSASEADRGSGTAKTRSELAARVIGDQDLSDREVLGQYRAVILTNVGHIPDNVADQLNAYVEHGGVVMLFMGPRVDGEDYNRVLLNEKRHLLPGKLVDKMTASAAGKDAFHYDFNPEGNLSNYLSEFKGNPNSGLNSADITTYWRLNVTDPAAERVLNYVPLEKGAAGAASQPVGDPAIVVHGVGKGRVIFFSTTANAEWTTLPAHPAYVPLIHELIAKAVEPGDAWMNLTVGEPVEVPAELNLAAVPTLTDDAKRDIPVVAEQNKEGQTIYRSRPLNRPGVYRLTAGPVIYPIAVNVGSDEADVRTLPEPAIRKALGDVALTMHGDQPPTGDSAIRVDHGRDLGWSCMLIVLALVAFECFLAMRFGHYRRNVVPA
jgi:hypothetical protein